MGSSYGLIACKDLVLVLESLDGLAYLLLGSYQNTKDRQNEDREVLEYPESWNPSPSVSFPFLCLPLLPVCLYVYVCAHRYACV